MLKGKRSLESDDGEMRNLVGERKSRIGMGQERERKRGVVYERKREGERESG